MSYEVVDAVYVEINGVPSATPAWRCLNPMELRQGPPTRGRDRLIPGATGVLPGKRRAAPAQRVLEWLVNGDVDWEGTAYPDANDGLDENLMHLRDQVTDPRGDPIEAVLHLPDGSTVVGDVHVDSFEWGYWGSDARAAMTVTVLAGALVGGGS